MSIVDPGSVAIATTATGGVAHALARHGPAFLRAFGLMVFGLEFPRFRGRLTSEDWTSPTGPLGSLG